MPMNVFFENPERVKTLDFAELGTLKTKLKYDWMGTGECLLFCFIIRSTVLNNMEWNYLDSPSQTDGKHCVHNL